MERRRKTRPRAHSAGSHRPRREYAISNHSWLASRHTLACDTIAACTGLRRDAPAHRYAGRASSPQRRASRQEPEHVDKAHPCAPWSQGLHVARARPKAAPGVAAFAASKPGCASLTRATLACYPRTKIGGLEPPYGTCLIRNHRSMQRCTRISVLSRPKAGRNRFKASGEILPLTTTSSASCSAPITRISMITPVLGHRWTWKRHAGKAGRCRESTSSRSSVKSSTSSNASITSLLRCSQKWLCIARHNASPSGISKT